MGSHGWQMECHEVDISKIYWFQRLDHEPGGPQSVHGFLWPFVRTSPSQSRPSIETSSYCWPASRPLERAIRFSMLRRRWRPVASTDSLSAWPTPWRGVASRERSLERSTRVSLWTIGRRRDSGGRVLVGGGDRDCPSAARTAVRIPGIDPGANRRTRRPYYQAETALQVLDLIEAPEGGSTWLKWWRRWASNPRPETLGNRHLHH